MKRFIAVLSSLLVMPAFAEVAPVYYDDVIEYSDAEILADGDVVGDEIVADDTSKNSVATPSVASGRASTSGRTASRAIPSVSTGAATRGTSSRAMAARTTTARTATNRSVNSNVASRGTASRAATATASQGVVSRRNASNSGATNTARASIVQTDTVSTPLYTGRVSMRSSAMRARVPSVSVTGNVTTTTTTAETIAEATQSMDEIAQMTDYCKAQYTSCMDNFCNVLNDLQGRCSCSKNVKNYEKTEEALKLATQELQDVAQQIQYIGLSADEVNTLFAETEAEAALGSSTDNSHIKNNLDKIRDMIVEVKSGTATSSDSTSGISLDLSGLLDFNIDSSGFDLSSLFGTNTANTASISNQRGEQLYKTAAARCKAAVLNECQAQGVDISVISNSYDLEIDKQCVAYERSLTDSNDQMAATVRNAKNVLQKARLMVAQQKNSYDLRGCVNALDSCMQDDFVCGTDYEYCLDPSGKYIVEGEIVIGSTPGQAISSATVQAPDYYTERLYSTWNYGDKNAFSDDGQLVEYINQSTSADAWKSDKVDDGLPQVLPNDNNMAKYLMYKIGYNQDGRDYGMCMSVLNKCQKYTYDDNNEYIPNNTVIKEYFMRTMSSIKVMQDEVLSSHAESCLSDVSSCLSQNNYSDSDESKAHIAINACKSQIKTCMSVNGDASAEPQPTSMKTWIDAVVLPTTTNTQN